MPRDQYTPTLVLHSWPDWVAEPPTVTHNVYLHEHAMIASHDVTCSVCWIAPAFLKRNMTPGAYNETWQPCMTCQADGWRMVKVAPSWWKRLLRSIRLARDSAARKE